MKKIFLLVIILLGICIFSGEKVKPVSYLNNNANFNLEDYNIYYLNLEDENITTKNISKYVNNMDVISMHLYVNPIYEKIIGKIKYDFNNNISLKQNIKNMVNYYKELLESKSFIEDKIYDEIKINEVVVYANGNDILNLLYENNLIKYKRVFKGEYKYLEV